jgi:cAMP-dependent protein kinase regulator
MCVQVPILASVNKYERLQMADALQSRTYQDRDVICKQGDVGDEFFILVEGEVVFTQTNDKGETGEVGRTSNPGSYFGEGGGGGGGGDGGGRGKRGVEMGVGGRGKG